MRGRCGRTGLGSRDPLRGTLAHFDIASSAPLAKQLKANIQVASRGGATRPTGGLRGL